jgi:hypothetical protein
MHNDSYTQFITWLLAPIFFETTFSTVKSQDVIDGNNVHFSAKTNDQMSFGKLVCQDKS